MKQFNQAFAAAAILTLPTAVQALRLGDTLGGTGKFALGLNYERIGGQDLDASSGHYTRDVLGVSGNGSFPELGDQLSDAELDSSKWFAEGSIGLHPRIDAFVKLGGASTDADFRLSEPGISNDTFGIDGGSDLAWGLGVRAKLFEDNGLRVMARAEYFNSDADADINVNSGSFAQWFAADLASAGATNVAASGSGDIELEEFRVALVAGKNFGNITPYAGVEYRYTELSMDAHVTGSETLGPFSYSIHQEFETQDAFGLLVGMDANFNQNLALNTEVGFIYGTTFRIGGEWRF